MLGKVTRGRKQLQMLSDVTSKTYKDLKREAGADEIVGNLLSGRNPKREFMYRCTGFNDCDVTEDNNRHCN